MIWFVFCVFFALFMNTSLSSFLGVTSVTTFAFMPFTLLLLKEIFLKRIDLKNNKDELRILILAVCIIGFKFFIGQNYFKYVSTLLIIPMLISVYLATVSVAKLKVLKKIVELFYIIECIMAIYEKFTQSLLLYNPIYGYLESVKSVQSWNFRSGALLGHPLANAMVVAVIMTFVVIDKNIAKLKKYLLVSLGMLALLSFNSRGAIIVVCVFTLPYFIIKEFKNQKTKNKAIVLLMLVALVFTSVYFIINSSLGGRLAASDSLIDGSAQTRLDVYKFYTYLSDYDLWYGNQDSYLYITKKLGAGGVENGIIVYILNFGVWIAPLLLVLLFKFQYKKLKIYSAKERWLILAVFYIIGIMNPNLAISVQWMVFVFAYYAYKEQLIKS